MRDPQVIPNPLVSFTYPVDIESSARYQCPTKPPLADFSKRAVSKVLINSNSTAQYIITNALREQNKPLLGHIGLFFIVMSGTKNDCCILLILPRPTAD